MRATLLLIRKTFPSGEKHPLGDAAPRMSAEYIALGSVGHDFESCGFRYSANDRLGQRLGIGAIDQKAVSATIGQFRQTVTCKPHDRRAREHRLEIDLAPRIVR